MTVPKNVLIVDDDAPTRLLEVVVLRGAGYVVSQARTGEAAIEELEKKTPDLVLLDLKLPGIDGWGVLEHIVGMAPTPLVIVVTGAHGVRAPDHLKAYVECVLAKPFEPRDLLATCERVLAA